jgi:hypothetical protein
MTAFSLKPFPGDLFPVPLEIAGDITRSGSTLALDYELRGNIEGVALPGPAPQPARRHGLWEETCFEFFLAEKKAEAYWEVNFSPAGHWNVYRFEAYRQGMQAEPAFSALPVTVQRDSHVFRLEAAMDLGILIPAAKVLKAGITAVIKGQDGSLSYWALTHPGPHPDFHRRDSFIITL